MRIKYLISAICFAWMIPMVFSQPFVQERVVIHYDRDLYLSGEKIWMKLYVTDAAFNRLSTFSKVVYVELWSPEGNPVTQLRVPVVHGMGQVCLPVESGLSTGYYQIRAYTRWMTNGSAENFFLATVAVVNPAEEIPVFDELPENLSDKLIIALFPEGGNLVAGLESRVGVAVKDKWGRGVETSGWISDSSGTRLSEFFTDDRGLGVFSITVEPNRDLKVFVRKKDGNPQQVFLPDVQEVGVSLMAEQKPNGDISVAIRSTLSDEEMLTVHMERGGVELAPVTVKLSGGETRISVPSGFFPEGVLEIFIKDRNARILARRNIWITDLKPLMVNIQLSSEAVSVGTRIVADIQTVDINGNPRPANLSLSVAKKAPLPFGFAERNKLVNDLDMLCRPLAPLASEKKPSVIPELYGMTLSGSVSETPHTSGARIFLAVPGKIPYVRVAKPNTAGRFYFQLEDLYGVKEVVVFGVDSARNPLKVVLDPAIAAGTPPPVSPTLSFSRAEARQLQEIFLNQQIQSAYGDIISLSEPMPVPEMQPFFGQAERKYHLDDYTRFSIEETFIEIVYQVHVLHRQNQTLLRIYDQYQDAMLEEDPLMLVDGIPFLQAENLLGVNTRQIEDIEVLSTLYYADGDFFHGAVHLITYDGNGEAVKLPDSYLRQNYSLYTAPEIFSPVIKKENTSAHIPDFRNLLHWEPDIRTGEDGKARIEFYTSDATGKYEVRVLALTSDGLSETVVTQLEVVNP
ncbi:MAG: hypothetical protein R3D00_15730 [Bacteroidia bacterium]